MSLDKLQGLPAQPPFDAATVERVKDLLNSGDVDVNDVSGYFSVPKSVVIQSLTNIAPDAYTSGSLEASQVDAVQNLIEKGVVSTTDVSDYFQAPQEVVERNLTEQLGYTPTQIAQAREGTPVSAKEITEQPKTREDLTTGLLGAEQALTGGAQAAIDRLDEINRAGRQDLETQYALGLTDAESAANQARQDITESFGRAEAMFDPYQQAGTTALQNQLALTGALGKEAFDQAYQESPQMAFLREQGMRANLAGAAATGGLGGGNVQKELQRFGQGLASTDLQNQINNLAALSGQGLSAAGSAATTATSGGANLANIATGLGDQQLRTRTNLGNQLSSYGLSTGLPAAGYLNSLGVNLAAGRTATGRDIAAAEAALASNAANIYASQGANLSGLIGNQGAYVSDVYGNAATNEARSQEGFGTNISNTQGNIASGISGAPNAPIYAPNYQDLAANALYAAGAGYDLFQPNTGQSSPLSGSGRMNVGGYFPQGYFNQPVAGAPVTGMNYDPQLYANQNLQGLS